MFKKLGTGMLLLWLGPTGFLVGGLRAQQTTAQADADTDATATTVSARATSDTLPAVKEVVSKGVEALGGREAWMRSKSRRMKGLFQSEDSSIFVGIEILQKLPNKSLTKVTLPNGVVIREVCDGKEAWIEDARGGYHQFVGPAQAFRLKQAALLANMTTFDEAANGKLIGVQKVGTHTTYVVEFAENKNLTSRLYFDEDTWLVARTEDVFTTPDGRYTVRMDLEDYRDVDGLKFPFRIKRMERGAVTTVRLTQISMNPEIDDTIFLKPETARN
jgi:zinc protease